MPDSIRPSHPYFKHHSFLLVSQPVRSAADPTAAIVFNEVLLRVSTGSIESGLEHWHTKLVPTEPFIEQMLNNPNASIALDMWVAEKVSKLDGPENYSINITHHSLESSEWLRYCDGNFARFKIEISEMRPLTDTALENIKELSKRREIYVDDYGQGNATVDSLLKLQPYLTGIKLDGLFLRGMSGLDPMARTLLGSTLATIYRLHESGDTPLTVIMENVETPSQLAELIIIKSEFAPLLQLSCQGYLISKPRLLPLPVEHFDPALI